MELFEEIEKALELLSSPSDFPYEERVKMAQDALERLKAAKKAAIKDMRETAENGDTECSHGYGDTILERFAPKKVVDIFEDMEKWYA